MFGNDDGYVIGPRVEAKAALDNFRDRIWTRCGLRLQEEKTELFSGRDLNQEELFGMKKAGVMLEDGFAPGFICYGIPVGCPRYVSHMLREGGGDSQGGGGDNRDLVRGQSSTVGGAPSLSRSQI